MNEHDLFRAIGAMDESKLSACEAPASRRRLRPIGKLLLLAAVIAALSVSALAAPAIYNAITHAELRQNDRLLETPGDDLSSDQLGGTELYLHIDANEDAPATLQQPYLPTAILGEGAGYCYRYDDLFLYWRGDYRFEQYVLPQSSEASFEAPLRTIQGSNGRSEMKTYAGISVLEVVFEGMFDGETATTRQLYWSDGDYLYYLLLPSDADAEQILSTLTAFTDIDSYLRKPDNKPGCPILMP